MVSRHLFGTPNRYTSPLDSRLYQMKKAGFAIATTLFLAVVELCAQDIDLLIKEGHVIDPKNNISRKMDVAISAGTIAAVGADIEETRAKNVIEARGLYI